MRQQVKIERVGRQGWHEKNRHPVTLATHRERLLAHCNFRFGQRLVSTYREQAVLMDEIVRTEVSRHKTGCIVVALHRIGDPGQAALKQVLQPRHTARKRRRQTGHELGIGI